MSECDRCGYERDELETIELRAEYELCGGCVNDMDASIDEYQWQDRYTEEQHERALSLLDEYDEFECVISSYDDGQIIVHTRYVTSDVITDFCNHFRFDIISFGPQWAADGMWPCASEHGDIFEIVLEYNHSCAPPIPLPAKFRENHIERLDGNDKQF